MGQSEQIVVHVIKAVRPRNVKKEWVVYVRCPNCHKIHSYQAGREDNIKDMDLGYRISHCNITPTITYKLVIDKQTKVV